MLTSLRFEGSRASARNQGTFARATQYWQKAQGRPFRFRTRRVRRLAGNGYAGIYALRTSPPLESLVRSASIGELFPLTALSHSRTAQRIILSISDGNLTAGRAIRPHGGAGESFQVPDLGPHSRP